MEKVRQSFVRCPRKSTRVTAYELGMLQKTVWGIFPKKIKFQAVSIDTTSNRGQKRNSSVNSTALARLAPLQVESYVWWRVHVNLLKGQHECRPGVINRWIMILLGWAGGIIGPYFFIPELNNHDVQELWFQQDGATCHTARATIDLLKDTFGDRLISRFGPVNWPPRSCDLTPLDYFLWGYVKSLVYADKPQTLDHLEDNIRRVIADIRPQMLEKVIENWTSRLDYIRASRGSPMPEIIFKM
ncbi:uncharacterized protein TNCV_4574411 [Trichonephila clavipes]|nr:uncharacterized protein TNCV_4574411 [Trichonephila clavipes]